MPGPEYSDDYLDPRLAILYDRMNPGRDDTDFYVGLMASAGAVLDVGCGTGTLLHAARAAGHTGRLVGLDPAAAMLDQARDRRGGADWILGDLSTVRFDREFDLVIMTGHVFQVFLTDDDIAAALAAVRASLVSGGRFAFETMNPRVRPWEHWVGSMDVTAPDGTDITAGNAEIRLVDAHTVEVVGRFTSPAWDREILCPSRFRFVDVDTLDAFLDAAGFTVVARYGGWDRRPFTGDELEIITIAA